MFWFKSILPHLNHSLTAPLSLTLTLTVLSFLVSPALSFGQYQKTLDSLLSLNEDELSNRELVNVYYQRSWYAYSLGDPKQSIEHAKNSYTLSHQMELDTLFSKSTIILASGLINTFDYEGAEKYLRKARAYFRKKKPKSFSKEKARINILLADALANKLQYAEALSLHEESQKLSMGMKDTDAVVISLLSQARLHSDVGLYSKSLVRLQEAEDLILSGKDRTNYSLIYSLRAGTYSKMHSPVSGTNLLKEAIRHESKRDNPNSQAIGDYYFNMSDMFYDQQKYDSVLYALGKALDVFEKHGDDYRIIACRIRKARTFSATKRWKEGVDQLNMIPDVPLNLKAEYFITKALLTEPNNINQAIIYADSSRYYAEKARSLFGLKYAYKELKRLQGIAKNWREAFIASEHYSSLSDSLLKRKEIIAVQAMELDALEKEKNAIIDQKKQEFAAEKSKKESWIRIFIVSVILLVFVAVVILLRAKNHKQRLLLEQKERQLVEKETTELKRDIQDFSLNVARYNGFIESLNTKINTLRSQGAPDINELYVLTQQFVIQRKKNELFQEKVGLMENVFFEKLDAIQKLTKSEKRLCAFLKLEMSSKEIAEILNVSEKTVEVYRSRLRKKLGIDSSTSFTDYFAQL